MSTPQALSKLSQVEAALKKKSLMTTAELESLGVSREYIRKLRNSGRIARVSRGIYQLPDAEIESNHSIAEAAQLIPNGVVCLLSVLRYHQLTTQSPFEVWMAVESGAWLPRQDAVPVRIFRPRGPAFHEGIEHITIEGMPVRIYSLAKTVADCFKYRHKIGLDVALEALRETLGNKVVAMDDLWHYAKVCRVTNVMRPYLEAIN